MRAVIDAGRRRAARGRRSRPRSAERTAPTWRCSWRAAPTARLAHARFGELGRFLRPGDLLVVNTSATLPAALPARLDGEDVLLHLSTPAEATGNWVVELRTRRAAAVPAPPDGRGLELPGGAGRSCSRPTSASSRLSVARLSLGEPVEDYLRRHGRPIRYRHSPSELADRRLPDGLRRRPRQRRDAERGAAVHGELVAELAARGVLFAPLTLHAGVSSLELGESPYPERYRVPARHRAARERRARAGAAG